MVVKIFNPTNNSNLGPPLPKLYAIEQACFEFCLLSDLVMMAWQLANPLRHILACIYTNELSINMNITSYPNPKVTNKNPKQ
jgi:hypothetical protein